MIRKEDFWAKILSSNEIQRYWKPKKKESYRSLGLEVFTTPRSCANCSKVRKRDRCKELNTCAKYLSDIWVCAIWVADMDAMRRNLEGSGKKEASEISQDFIVYFAEGDELKYYSGFVNEASGFLPMTAFWDLVGRNGQYGFIHEKNSDHKYVDESDCKLNNIELEDRLKIADKMRGIRKAL